MNISLLTSGHLPFDDRIFWHIGKTLSEAGHNVEIISSKSPAREQTEGISLNCFEGDSLTKKAKTGRFIELLENSRPDLIICSEPLPVIAGNRFRKRSGKHAIILYDITEWYPSSNNLSPHNFYLRWLVFLKLLAFNIFAAYISDAFIFGEWYKSMPYRSLFPFKSFLILTYYPDLRYLKHTDPQQLNKTLRLVYSGKISVEKGFGNFMNVIRKLSDHHKDLQINLKIIGWYGSEDDRRSCEPLLNVSDKNIFVEIKGRQEFRDFISEITGTDIFLDLREAGFETHRSLPIRLFYYAALGRPVIFTDLKAIRRDVEIEKFGFLVKPENADTVSDIISGYIANQELYLEHCRNARKLAEGKYNWQLISPAFIRFIESFSPR
jgi:glycosyltransferase involved in cell wall biosynthesis